MRGDHCRRRWRAATTALIELTNKFDRAASPPATLRVGAPKSTPRRRDATPSALDALKLARDRIEAYHRRQLPKDERFTDALGVELGYRWTAIAAVGLYVPGGTAAYPSSVLMNAVPAKVAGVPRLVMVVPAPDGKLNPLVLAAAKLAGVDEIYRVGGAQAVAALAYGTQTIKPVDKIVGPGNAYVAAAKRLVFGKVGIDMIAGPSEVLILADRDANPDWIAADLLAQAEHDAAAQSILITDERRARGAMLRRPSRRSSRRCRAQRSPARRGRISARSFWCAISTRRCRWSMPSRPSISRSWRRDADALADKIRNTGAIFHWRAHAGSDRRLCRRLQPRAADGALGAFFVGPRRARFHEAHVDPQMRPRSARRARPRGDRARRSGRARRARALGGDPAQPQMSTRRAGASAISSR